MPQQEKLESEDSTLQDLVTAIAQELGRDPRRSESARRFLETWAGSVEGLRAQSHLAAIVESADDAIISKDLNGVIQSWNPGAERIFGYTATEMIGQPILRLVPPGLEDEEVTILARLRAGERIIGHATKRRRKDGALVPVSLTISPVRNHEGQIIGASKIARDITAELEASDAQKALIRRLQDALAEIRTLRSLLPICMHCKKIRDDRGAWSRFEIYLSSHANFDFTHGICPECLQRSYAQIEPAQPCDRQSNGD